MKFIMIEDHSLVRQGISKIIEEKSDFSCAGIFETVNEAKEFLKEYCKSFEHEPLICIIDVNLGNDDGISLIRFIKEKYQNIYCICYSMFKGSGIVEQAVSVGAVGYVSKNAELEVLLEAMKQADKGKFYMEKTLISDYVVYTNLLHSLTKREKELIDFFLLKKSEDEIAQLMCITPRAVDNYFTRILSKLGVVTKKELLQKFGV